MFLGNIIKGQMAMSSDLGLVQSLVQDPNTKAVFVGDPTGYEDIIKSTGFVVASSLVPDYRIMEFDINGEYDKFTATYFEYLKQETPSMMLATILYALNKGRNIILFYPPQADGLHYPIVLANFICSFFGIVVSNGTIPFQYNPAYDWSIAGLMYRFNLLSPQQYLLWAQDSFTMFADKLAYDLNLQNVQGQDIIQYLTNYRNSMLQENKILIKPFTWRYNQC